MSASPRDAARLGIGIIGAGKVGCVLGSALRAVDHAVIGINARSAASRERAEIFLPQTPLLSAAEIVERSELVLIAVPDDQIAPLVEDLAKAGAWHAGQLVVHVSGRMGIAPLLSAQRLGAIPLAIHPAMTFTGTNYDLLRLQGCTFAVTAPPIAVPIAQALAVELGGEPIVIAESDRAIYHAALSHGANYLVTLVAQASSLMRSIGVSEPAALLGPLLRATLDNALSAGDAALMGPIRRGDVGTVEGHLAALQELAADAGNTGGEAQEIRDTELTYRALMAATVRRSERAGTISSATAAKFTSLAIDSSKASARSAAPADLRDLEPGGPRNEF